MFPSTFKKKSGQKVIIFEILGGFGHFSIFSEIENGRLRAATKGSAEKATRQVSIFEMGCPKRV